MFVSRPMKVQSILCLAKLVTMMTEVSHASHMVYLNMVSHICGMLACIITVSALPEAIWIFPHL